MEIMEIIGWRQIIHGFHGQPQEGVWIKPLPITKAAKQPGQGPDRRSAAPDPFPE